MEPLRIDKREQPANLAGGGTIKVSLDDPLCKLAAVVNVQQEPTAVSCNISRSSSSKNNIHSMRSSTLDDEEAVAEHSRNPLSKHACLGKSLSHWILLVSSCLMVVVGMSSGTLLGRLYFMHGGSRRWLSTWTQSVGWPINLVPLLISYLWFSIRPTPLTPKLALIYVAMGCLTAIDNLLYAWGLSYLPASTNSLLCSCQLAFNVLFSYVLVGQKITAYVVNSVVTLTIGAILLGIYAENDRPPGTTEGQYIVGFVVTVAAAALYALILPLTELIYRKVLGKSSFVVVMEAQTAIAMAATAVSMAGMSVHNDYAGLGEEAARFKLGPQVYSITLVGCAVGWQLFFLGSAGIIFLTSSLMSCVFFTATLPVVPVLAVIVFHDNFSAIKGIAMVLSMWGFVSYIYGGYVVSRCAKTMSAKKLNGQQHDETSGCRRDSQV